MKLRPWMVFLCLGIVACSGPKSSPTVGEESAQIELSDSNEFEDDTTETDSSSVTSENESMETDDPSSVTSENETSMTDDVVVANNEPIVEDSNLEQSVITNEPGTIKQYVVEKNETLMMIAFKIYGDYSRWKDLANQNSQKLKSTSFVRPGMSLDYVAPAEEFSWNPEGNPYLIKTGDTLGGISKEVYSSTKKWKLLWENNRPLIKDPNKIYAGFTLYYLDNGREVANQ